MNYVKYKEDVYEAHQYGTEGFALKRYDSEQSMIVPRGDNNFHHATEEDIHEYIVEKAAYLQSLRMAHDAPYLCNAMNCKGYRKAGSDFCHAHSPAEDEMEVAEPVAWNTFDRQLVEVLTELEKLLRKKNKDYGSSYDKSVEKYGEQVALIRLGDKFNRLDTLILSDSQGEVDESIEETLLDLVGYGIIELVRRRRA